MNSVEVTSYDSDPRIELKKGNCNNSKKQHDSSVLVNIASGEATSEKRLNLDYVIPLEKFSSLQRLMRVTAYVLRFVSNLKQSKMKKELIDGEVTQGRDGQVRSAVVRVKSGNSPTAEWRRPLQRLYPLEVKLDTEAVNPVPQAENVSVRLVRDEDVPVVVVNSDEDRFIKLTLSRYDFYP